MMSRLIGLYVVAVLLALGVVEAAPQVSQAPLVWLTSPSLAEAQAQARAEGKSILLFFHGSDWCPACVEMEKQVMKSAQFAQFARQSLILVDLDFPAKRKQEEALRQANLALKAKFNLSPEPAEGFPTIVLLDGEGRTVFQETGYSGGGPADVLSRLQRHAVPRRSGPFSDVTVDEFAKLAADKANVVLDVRTPSEFQAGHIPGAVNLDVTAPDFQGKAAALDKRKTYLVLCASGIRSQRACEALGRLNFPNLYNLPSGFGSWARAGKPVER